MKFYLGSEMSLALVPFSPRLWAATAAAAIVFTLLGARGQS